MHNIEQIIRRLRLSGSGIQLSPGENRMLFIHLLKRIEDLEHEISLRGSEASTESRTTLPSSGPKLRGRGRPKSESKSGASSGGEGTDSKT